MDVCFFVIPAQAGIRRFGIVFKRSGSDSCRCGNDALIYSGLNLNQDKATKPQTVQIVRQGEATPYWFKFKTRLPSD
ncbi:hypothetical protein FGF64_08560 [Neisseria meningitidis]|nr:hypothetical protein [Neisseria meningitidis]